MWTMFDAADPSKIPTTGDAYAGYADGGDYTTLQTMFPTKPVLDIATSLPIDATCFDMESGDGAITDGPTWFNRQKARGLAFPWLYTSVDNVNILVSTMSNGGVDRTKYILFSAHYWPGNGTFTKHICSPVCTPGLVTTADATQWMDTVDYDQSVLTDKAYYVLPSPLKPIIEDDLDMALYVYVALNSSNPTEQWLVSDFNRTKVPILSDSQANNLMTHFGQTTKVSCNPTFLAAYKTVTGS